MLKLRVEDFGPIREGTIGLRPLTILIGPNNAGKSYFAVLAYALISPLTRPAFRAPYYRGRGWVFPGLDVSLPPDVNKSVSEKRKQGERFRFDQLDSRVQAAFGEAINAFLEQAARLLNDELRRCFGAEIPKLARRPNRGNFSVAIEQAQPSVRLDLSLSGSALRLNSRHWETPADEFNLREARGVPPQLIGDDLCFRVIRRLFPFLFSSSYYLPAARSGILQGHRLLTRLVLAQLPLFGIEQFDVPMLSGVIADFIGNLLQVEQARRSKRISAVATFLESHICKGKIDLASAEPKLAYPEIQYFHHGQKLLLHRTSSMVSEIAPIVLFLKHLVNEHDFLVIEEPEAHLHPDNQRTLARAIAKLIRNGVHVLITTHSDYFVHQISNFVRLGQAPEMRTRLSYGEEEYLSAAEVAAYLFRFEERGDGSVIEELPVTDEDGIPEEEFVRIAEAIYDETTALERVRARL